MNNIELFVYLSMFVLGVIFGRITMAIQMEMMRKIKPRDKDSIEKSKKRMEKIENMLFPKDKRDKEEKSSSDSDDK